MKGYLFLILVASASKIAVCDHNDDFLCKLGIVSYLPGESCAEIYRLNKASRGRSGYYWVRNPSLRRVYCNMVLECGMVKGGWTRAAYFDTSAGYTCPSTWTRITMPGTTRRVCRPGLLGGCYSAFYSTLGVTFSKVCGQVVAYQKGSTDAFRASSIGAKSINGPYVDGVSITVSSSSARKHVWTYASGLSDNWSYPSYNCPCAHVSGPDPPSFVGNNYYCESGNTGTYSLSTYYTTDVLWDMKNCVGTNNNCCTNPDMPWFFRQFARNMQGVNLEARICHSHSFANEATLVERLELYVQ